jgi:ketosteroid isomerase-like protein
VLIVRNSMAMNKESNDMSDVKTLDSQLNKQILAGDILGAFDKFYADDVVMQENTTDPFKGKALNREREQKFVESVEQFHGMQLLGGAVEGDRSYSEWEMDVTFKGGQRVKMSQVAARHWKDGKIAFERFYYKG